MPHTQSGGHVEAVRGWATAQPIEVAAVAVIAIALTALMTYPLAFRAGSVGRIYSGDGQLSIWNVAWVARILIVNPDRLYDANIFYPHPGALAFSEANLGAGVLAVPVYWATRNPYLAHNVVVLLAFVLALGGMYSLVRFLTGNRGAAAVSAVAFAFAPYMFARLAHIQLLMTAGLPLTLLAVHRLVDRQTPIRAGTLGLVLAAQALSCGYYGIFAGLTTALGALVFGVREQRWRNATYWMAFAGAALVAVAVVLPFFAPYWRMRQELRFARSLDEAIQWSADWRAYFASSAIAHRWMLRWLEHWNEVLFPGYLTTVLAAASLVVISGLRSANTAAGLWPSTRVMSRREVTVFYALLAALAWWVSLGPVGRLYSVLYHAIPLFTFLRAPGRFGMVFVFALAVLAGLAMDTLTARRRYGRWITALVTVLILAELVQAPLYFPAAPPVSTPYRVLATLPRGAVLELPFFSRRIDFHRHAIYMLNSTIHWQPLINGYSDHIPQDFRDAAVPLSTFPSEESFRILQERRGRYVVIHLNFYNQQNRRELQHRLEEFQQHLRPLAREGDIELYEIISWPR